MCSATKSPGRRLCGLLPATLFIVSTPAIASSAPVQPTRDQLSRAKDTLQQWVRPAAPGCAVGVVSDGEFLLQETFGLASLQQQVPIDSKTVFDIASMSKQFTALAVLLLEKEASLSLDDEVSRLLPEVAAGQTGRPLLVRHLLDHTSGLHDYLGLLQFLGIDKTRDFLSPRRALDLILAQSDFPVEPGQRHMYTNSGYFLLGLIVERVSGLPLAEFARSRIFEPLGMTRTLYLDDMSRVVAGRARGYAPVSTGGFRLDEMNFPEVGPGGVQTSLDDLLQWVRNFNSTRVGTPEIMQRMTTPTRLNEGSVGPYGLGFFVREYRGLPIVDHAGAVNGFNSDLLRFPQEDLTVLVLCNRKGIDPQEVSRGIADVLLEDRLDTPSAESKGAPTPLSGETVADTPGPLPDRLAGIYYQLYGDARLSLEVDRGRLTATLASDQGETPLELTPQGDAGFRVAGMPGLAAAEYRPGTARMAAALFLTSARGQTVRFVKAPPLSELDEESLEGRYESPALGVSYLVTASGRHVRIRLGGRPERVIFDDLVRIAPDRFLRGGETGVELERNAQGEVTGLTVFSDRDIRLRFDKVPWSLTPAAEPPPDRCGRRCGTARSTPATPVPAAHRRPRRR